MKRRQTTDRSTYPEDARCISRLGERRRHDGGDGHTYVRAILTLDSRGSTTGGRQDARGQSYSRRRGTRTILLADYNGETTLVNNATRLIYERQDGTARIEGQILASEEDGLHPRLDEDAPRQLQTR